MGLDFVGTYDAAHLYAWGILRYRSYRNVAEVHIIVVEGKLRTGAALRVEKVVSFD